VQPTRPSRGTWLGVIRAVLLFVLILDILALPLMVLPNGALRLGTVGVQDLWGNGGLPPSHHPEVSGYDVIIWLNRHPTPLQYVLFKLGNGFLYFAVTIPMLFKAQRLARAAQHGDPFTMPMVRRVRNLGLVVLGGGLLAEAGSWVCKWAVMQIYLDRYHADAMMRFDAWPDYQLSLWWVLPGLILLGMSEVVRRGVDLRAELDTVI
jgi:Protein of unknown function (DUF2975)